MLWMYRREPIEGSWSEVKQVGGSTQEMNHGHQHNTLNDMQNDWNWMKNQNKGMYCHLFLTQLWLTGN